MVCVTLMAVGCVARPRPRGAGAGLGPGWGLGAGGARTRARSAAHGTHTYDIELKSSRHTSLVTGTQGPLYALAPLGRRGASLCVWGRGVETRTGAGRGGGPGAAQGREVEFSPHATRMKNETPTPGRRRTPTPTRGHARCPAGREAHFTPLYAIPSYLILCSAPAACGRATRWPVM